VLKEPGAVETASLEARVAAVVAETTGAALAGPLAGSALDSLTLVAIVARIEAVFGVAFETDETVALLTARSAGEVARLIARKVAAQAQNLDAIAGNDGCGRDREAP
jgi:acyl carrier protein